MVLKSSPVVMSSDAIPEPLEATLDQLVEGDFREKWEAAKQLIDWGDPAIAHLAKLLQSEEDDWEVRWFAARTLGQFDHPAALEALVQLLQQTQEPELVAIAAEGLSHFGERGVAALVPLLDQPPHRLTGVQALASIQHSSVFVPLLAAAEDADATVRATALAALASFHHPEVDNLLLSAVQDVNTGVRREAITHLGLRAYLLNQMNLVDTLLPGLWDIHPEVNEATAIALGRLGTETAVAALARVLASPHTPTNLQRRLIQALGWIEKESALLALVAALQKLPQELQIIVIETLTRLQTPQLQQRAGDMLCDWLKTGWYQSSEDKNALRPAIALALGTLRHQPAIPLLQALKVDDDPQTRLYAEAALRQFLD